MSIEIAKQLHAEHVTPKLGSPVGAKPEDVEALERRLGFCLPQDYRDFLLWMGCDYEGIFRGSAWFIDCVFANKEVLRGLLQEAGSRYVLKDSHLVFFTHQGYMAAWFDTESSDRNPECWFMNDSMTEPHVTGLFSYALLKDIESLAPPL